MRDTNKGLINLNQEQNTLMGEQTKFQGLQAKIEQERHEQEKVGEIIIKEFRLTDIKIEENIQIKEQYNITLNYSYKIANIGKKEVQNIKINIIYFKDIYEEFSLFYLTSNDQWEENRELILGVYSKSIKQTLEDKYLKYLIEDNRRIVRSLKTKSGYLDFFSDILTPKKTNKETEEQFLVKASNVEIKIRITYVTNNKQVVKDYTFNYNMRYRLLKYNEPEIKITDYIPENSPESIRHEAETDSSIPLKNHKSTDGNTRAAYSVLDSVSKSIVLDTAPLPMRRSAIFFSPFFCATSSGV